LFEPEISPTILLILTNHGHDLYPKDQKKMEPIATWQKLLLGVLALLVILWFFPGINKMMGVSRNEKATGSDWPYPSRW